MILQLPEPFEVETPLGHGWAILLEATAHEYFWTVALDGGALVTFTQDRVRICESYTHKRGVPDARMKKIVTRTRT